MSTGKPLIESIIANIETVLKTISKANGFRTDVNLVTRTFKGWDELSSSDYPAVFIADSGVEDKADETNKEVGGAYPIQLWGYVRYNEHGVASDKASVTNNELIADAEEKLYADRERGGFAINTFIESVERFSGPFEPITGFIINVQIEYEHVGTDTTKRHSSAN